MSRPFAFPRRMRLVRGRDFEHVFREGSRARGGSVLVVVCPNGSEDTRLGLSVGRSIWKSAVKRNRVRRIFREAFRLSYPELPRGVDIVMIPAAPKLDPVLVEVRAELVALSRKAVERRTARAEKRTEARAGTRGGSGAPPGGGP
jgi:ribonuclease P protein component